MEKKVYLGRAHGERSMTSRGRWISVHWRPSRMRPYTMPKAAATRRRSTQRRRRRGENKALACPHMVSRNRFIMAGPEVRMQRAEAGRHPVQGAESESRDMPPQRAARLDGGSERSVCRPIEPPFQRHGQGQSDPQSHPGQPRVTAPETLMAPPRTIHTGVTTLVGALVRVPAQGLGTA